MRFYTIGETADALGVSQNTLRNWDKSNKFVPHHRSPSGNRYYTLEQINRYLESHNMVTIHTDFFSLSMEEMKTVISNYEDMLNILKSIYNKRVREGV